MNTKTTKHQPEHNHNIAHHKKQPYIKRMHRDWLFWLALVLMLLALLYYVVSDDFTIQFSPAQKH
jgi:hypothetical protein